MVIRTSPGLLTILVVSQDDGHTRKQSLMTKHERDEKMAPWSVILHMALIATLLVLVMSVLPSATATATKSDEAGLFADKGLVLIRIGDYHEAETAFNKSVSLDPSYAPGWAGYGQTLYLLGRYDEALAAFDRALALDPKDAGSWQRRGEVLYRQERYAEAVSSFGNATDLNPNQSRGYVLKGDALMNLGNGAEAVPAYEKALSHEPDNNLTWSHLGKAYMTLGNYSQALWSFDRAVQYAPNDAESWNNRGAALYHLGRYQEALTSYEKAVSIDPRFSVDRNATLQPNLAMVPDPGEVIHRIDEPIIFIPRASGGTGLPPMMFVINLVVMFAGVAGIVFLGIMFGVRRFRRGIKKK
jgi:tetratricopeptide (TPR) repeat protein